ncbi:MAG: hypothetical protein AAF198_00580 [Pseudomonadota bacterium]
MTDFQLTQKPPLGHYTRTISGVTLTEVVDIKILSVATPLNGEAQRDAEFVKIGLKATPSQKTATSGALTLIGMAKDQHFILASDVPFPKLKNVYLTDQTHSWVALRAEGPAIWPALERFCMLDLHPHVFKIGDARRFDTETMFTVMVKEDDHQVLLLSASSSAQSFLHAIETALVAVS